MTTVDTAPPRGVAALPVLRFVPGLVLLTVIGLIGKWAQGKLKDIGTATHTALPDIEYVLWAIVLGLVISNTVGVPRIFRAGVNSYEFWLKIGIVLLGARFLLGDLTKLGGVSLVLVFIDIAVATSIVLLLGKLFRLGGKLTSLLALGTAICGVSAIIAGKGAIEADDEDSGYAIAAILTLGAVALFTFPLIGHSLHLSDHEYGIWAGLAVDNTAETTAAGKLYSDQAGDIAVLVKSTRNALIGFAVLAYALYWSAKGQAKAVASGFLGRAGFVWEKFPKFVLGFLAVSALATEHAFTKADIASLGNLSKWAFLLCFAGVGLNINFRQLSRSGFRPFVVGALALVVVAGTALVEVLVASRVVGL
ncbi:putative sulfate exporter family transporter [Solihabitans fulvus]|uniref:Putative sulfate exporter family transporter n=1 Tax=Solihabitans fulvus TaxID=1892852 RepID=A0A5B2XR09_9PSEU|nr:putative sulfate exporter family transporter [Solihabitans fulvus]KAA2266087.1 putative sulfate exporter family transporter [Solihabitans fulvus]